ncbi:hypothetical protein SAMN05216188_11667 [Lentzea xinjiangensis]|uniref:LuxR family transcriptional regulator, maltose regulon positive regulatory protein n=1 Tax=Lentzea xinjiangensis TaxID=402600 RepID=A0A1H9SGH0_9PSEU|nr:hypothetical protein [Lentzea xinjiangensis]SER83493.1 hypothetical protein SAMN05216188_11667 [Lentzea xinjiangensis]
MGDDTTGLHAVPRPLDVELPRLRLVGRLDTRWTRPVTLVTAGAGFGKTTALAQAVRANLLEPRGIDAWVTCGPGHEDAAGLAASILRAAGARPSRAPGAPRTSLSHGGEPRARWPPSVPKTSLPPTVAAAMRSLMIGSPRPVLAYGQKSGDRALAER